MSDSSVDKGALKPVWPPGQIEGWDVSKLAPPSEPVRSKIVLGPEAQFAHDNHDRKANLIQDLLVAKGTRRQRRRSRP
jgi:hypothetical protein